MIGYLLKNEMIYDFLNKYGSNQWWQVISPVMQLGIIYLKQNYNNHLEPDDLNNLVEDILGNKPVKSRGRNSKPWKEQLRQSDREVNDRSSSKVRSFCSSGSKHSDMGEMFRNNRQISDANKQINKNNLNLQHCRDKIKCNNNRKISYGYQLSEDVINRQSNRSQVPEPKIRQVITYNKYIQNARERDNNKENFNMANDSYDKNMQPVSSHDKQNNCKEMIEIENKTNNNANSSKNHKSNRTYEQSIGYNQLSEDELSPNYDSNEDKISKKINKSLNDDKQELSSRYVNQIEYRKEIPNKQRFDSNDNNDPQNSLNSFKSNKAQNNVDRLCKTNKSKKFSDKNIEKIPNEENNNSFLFPKDKQSLNTSTHSNIFHVYDNDIVLNNSHSKYNRPSHKDYHDERREDTISELIIPVYKCNNYNNRNNSIDKQRKTGTIDCYKNEMRDLLERSKLPYDKKYSQTIKVDVSANTADFNKEDGDDMTFNTELDKLSSYAPSERKRGDYFFI
jgi:hypothetical protein